MTIIVLNGPNLNLLGTRQPEIYGTRTIDDLRQICLETITQHGHKGVFEQSNHEGTLIDLLHEHANTDGIVLNPGAFTHTSVALRDAISCISAPVVEVHISNIYAREAFRAHSYVSDVARACIAGMGFAGYIAAIRWVADAQS